jgi:hypothetical protein
MQQRQTRNDRLQCEELLAIGRPLELRIVRDAPVSPQDALHEQSLRQNLRTQSTPNIEFAWQRIGKPVPTHGPIHVAEWNSTLGPG